MREIELRAYDKTNKETHYNVAIVGRHIIFEYKSHGYDLVELDLTYLDILDGENQYEIMQYTGLTDKNNKKIYDGDILTNVKGYREHKFIVSWNDEECYFDLFAIRFDGSKGAALKKLTKKQC